MTAHYINTLAEFPSHTNPYYWIISLLEIGKENTVGCSFWLLIENDGSWSMPLCRQLKFNCFYKQPLWLLSVWYSFPTLFNNTAKLI